MCLSNLEVLKTSREWALLTGWSIYFYYLSMIGWSMISGRLPDITSYGMLWKNEIEKEKDLTNIQF
jgi:hypothetical protein